MIADEYWDSLAEMTRDVDAVVLGHPVAVEQRVVDFGDGYVAVVTHVRIAVDEVLTGELAFLENGTFELETGLTTEF